MKIIDKIKNFFYDEEEIEIYDSKNKKKEKPKASNINKETTPALKEKEISKVDDTISERELFKSETTFKFPIIFEDEDLGNQQKKRINVLEVENTKIKSETLTIKEHKIFIPSPIISPIYGIIEPLINEQNKANTKKNLYNKEGRIDIDSVISEVYQYSKKDKKDSKSKKGDIDLFKDIDQLKEDDKKKAIINDDARIKSIDELLESTDEQDFYTLIDTMYENVEEEELN